MVCTRSAGQGVNYKNNGDITQKQRHAITDFVMLRGDYMCKLIRLTLTPGCRIKGGTARSVIVHTPKGRERKSKRVEMRRFNACAAPSLCMQPAKRKERNAADTCSEKKMRVHTPLHTPLDDMVQDGETQSVLRPWTSSIV